MSFRKQLRKLNPLSYLPLVREVLALRSRQGPYRFVVRQWSGINDLNLASRVMETEYFKQDLIPVALPVREVRSILVLAPHQDDEAIGAGGALILASAAGVPIHIVFVTDGEEHGFFNIIESPVATILNNIGGTEAVLKMAAKKRKTVLVVSTSEVYGKSQSVPFREDGDLVSGPTSKSRWSYASSKIVDEFLALAYWREQKVPTIVVRPFNCMGPRQTGRYGMVVPRFIDQAVSGSNITVYGTGQQSRSFTYVSDIVQWMLALAQNSKAVGEVFNLGNPNEITMTDLAKRIITLTGSSSGIDYISYEQAYEHGFEDIDRRIPDIAKVTEVTGYHPAVGLDEALRRTCDWIASRAVRTGSAVHAGALK